MLNRLRNGYIRKAAALSRAYTITRMFKKGAAILFYHGVENKIINPVVQETHLQMDLFEQQMLFLKKNHEVISIDYLNECINEGYKISPSQVLLTFDDGYKSNLYTVAPFLKALNMPFAVFISTRYIDCNEDLRLPYYYLQAAIYYTKQKIVDISSIKMKFDVMTEQMRLTVIRRLLHIIKTVPSKLVGEIVDDLIRLLPEDRWLELNALFSSDELMNWDEVKKLHDSGVVIGAHCHDHAILHSNQSDAEIEFQLQNSKYLIEKHLGTCKYFSYPNGKVNDISHSAFMGVKKNKYLLGFTTMPGEVITGKFDPFLLPRIFHQKELDSFKFALNASFFKNSDYYKQYSGILY